MNIVHIIVMLIIYILMWVLYGLKGISLDTAIIGTFIFNFMVMYFTNQEE